MKNPWQKDLDRLLPVGLSIVEMLLVAGAVSYLHKSKVNRNSIHEKNEFQFLDPLAVVAEGMKRSGFRYTPGLLRSPWGEYVDVGLTGTQFIAERAEDE